MIVAPLNEMGGTAMARGTGQYKNVRGTQFEKDEDGNLILTSTIQTKALRDCYNEHLYDEDKWSGWTHVKEVMSKLDTIFYAISRDRWLKDEKFVHPLDPLALEYTAEQVNYIGVGLGFNHFHMFGHLFLTAQAFVLAWNLTQYGHLASPGEHYWADFGFDMYWVI